MKNISIRKVCRVAGIKIGLICKDNLWGIEYIDSPKGKAKRTGNAICRPFALLCSGYQIETIHQIRCMGYEPGFSMASVGPPRIIPGKKIEFVYSHDAAGLKVIVTFKAAGKGHVLHASVSATNKGTAPVTIEHISPLFPGLSTTENGEWAHNIHIHFARNSWFSEAQWYDRLICEEGLNAQNLLGESSSTVFQLHSTGSFSTARFLPMAILEDRIANKCYFWEIHYSGSWFMEVGVQAQRFYAVASGPTKISNCFWKTIYPGQLFTSIPIAFGTANGSFNEAVAELTKYRRADLRPKSKPDKKLPVIFNDYMHCLWGDPTEEREIPLIEAAARVGAEYYVIDAGWYAEFEKSWWDTVGQWQESPSRFPRGLQFLTDMIRAKGMIPGLWLEIEVMGINCPIADELPDSWFFQRNGKRIAAQNRYFLDFANPAVRKHCHGVVDRLVEKYNIGYLKIDYNVNHREGNEADYDSAAAGQIAHINGLYQWFDEVRKKHPNLIIENCGSGGGRLDYGILAHTHLQSTTDQTDYLRMPSITTGTLAAGLPEQVCQWAYPKYDAGPENIVFCMMVAMLSRFHLSSQIHKLSKRGVHLVEEAIATYKGYRQDIPKMVPFFPNGPTLIHCTNGFVVAGLRMENNSLAYLTVFRLDSKNKEIEIVLNDFDMKRLQVAILYPLKMPGSVKKTTKGIKVILPRKRTARLICLRAAKMRKGC